MNVADDGTEKFGSGHNGFEATCAILATVNAVEVGAYDFPCCVTTFVDTQFQKLHLGIIIVIDDLGLADVSDSANHRGVDRAQEPPQWIIDGGPIPPALRRVALD